MPYAVYYYNLPEQCSGMKCENYRGKQNKARDGSECKNWSEEKKSDWPNAGLEKNYCRNPDSEPSIWCYKIEGGWTFCDPLDDSIVEKQFYKTIEEAQEKFDRLLYKSGVSRIVDFNDLYDIYTIKE